MLQFGLRLGRHPRCLVATTPRPTKLIRELLAHEGRDVVVTRGSTYENRENLAAGFFDQIIRKYEGTRLGRQELNAELLEDTPGALWNHAIIDAMRQGAAPQLARIVVELLVELLPQRGIFEYTRQRAEAIGSPNSSPSQPDFTYAIGSLEWQRQQERAGGDRS